MNLSRLHYNTPNSVVGDRNSDPMSYPPYVQAKSKYKGVYLYYYGSGHSNGGESRRQREKTERGSSYSNINVAYGSDRLMGYITEDDKPLVLYNPSERSVPHIKVGEYIFAWLGEDDKHPKGVQTTLEEAIDFYGRSLRTPERWNQEKRNKKDYDEVVYHFYRYIVPYRPRSEDQIYRFSIRDVVLMENDILIFDNDINDIYYLRSRYLDSILNDYVDVYNERFGLTAYEIYLTGCAINSLGQRRGIDKIDSNWVTDEYIILSKLHLTYKNPTYYCRVFDLFYGCPIVKSLTLSDYHDIWRYGTFSPSYYREVDKWGFINHPDNKTKGLYDINSKLRGKIISLKHLLDIHEVDQDSEKVSDKIIMLDSTLDSLNTRISVNELRTNKIDFRTEKIENEVDMLRKEFEDTDISLFKRIEMIEDEHESIKEDIENITDLPVQKESGVSDISQQRERLFALFINFVSLFPANNVLSQYAGVYTKKQVKSFTSSDILRVSKMQVQGYTDVIILDSQGLSMDSIQNVKLAPENIGYVIIPEYLDPTYLFYYLSTLSISSDMSIEEIKNTKISILNANDRSIFDLYTNLLDNFDENYEKTMLTTFPEYYK